MNEITKLMPWPKVKAGMGNPRFYACAAEFLQAVLRYPKLHIVDTPLTFLLLEVDTRDGSFQVRDRSGKAVTPDKVLASARRSGEPNEETTEDPG
jgi:hypothetical protein